MLADCLINAKFIFTKQVKILSLVFVLVSLATLFNPNFISGALFPLQFFNNYAVPIEENQNIFLLSNYFDYKPFIGIIAVIAALFIFMCRYRKKVSLFDWLIFLVFSVGTIVVIRNVTLFTYAIFIPLVTTTGYVLEDLAKFLKNNVTRNKIKFLTFFALFAFIFVTLVSALKQIEYQPYGLGLTESGREAIDFFINNKLQGPIYNNIDSGQYLAFKLYPSEKVFVDGRPEAYPKDFFIQDNAMLFGKVNKQYKFNLIFLFHYFEN